MDEDVRSSAIDRHRRLLATKRYELVRVLAHGGMGVVYEAKHLLLDRSVAAKFLTLDSPVARELFLREGRALARLRHPNVVEIFDLDEIEGTPLMVMELLRGEPLSDRLEREKRLDVATVWALGKQVLNGLARAHAHGLVHRDVKPSNIFIEEKTGAVKLIDFGICADGGTPKEIAGTPSYLAPEQWQGHLLDARTDLWSTGVTFYELLSGRVPFRQASRELLRRTIIHDAEQPLHELHADIPRAVSDLVSRLLAKKPSERFQRVADVLDAGAAAFATGGEVHASAVQNYALIVQSDPALAALASKLAEERGLLGIFASRRDEWEELLRDVGPPRLAVVDLSLSDCELSGFDVLERLRTLGDARELALVATSPNQAFLKLASETKHLALGGAVRSSSPLDLKEAIRSSLTGEVMHPLAARSSHVSDAHRLAIVDDVVRVNPGAPDASLQQLVEDVAKSFNAPIALVSLVLEDRQWFKAYFGIGGELEAQRGTPIDQAFCRHVVESGQPLVVGDAVHHPVFRDNPLVTSGAVGSYVGAPLTTDRGNTLGTLCLIDSIPRSFGPRDVEELSALARRVAGEIGLATARTRPIDERSEVDLEDLKSTVRPPREDAEAPRPIAAELPGFEVDEEHKLVSITPSFERLFDVKEQELVGAPRDRVMQAIAHAFAQPSEFIAKTRVSRSGPFMATGEFTLDRGARKVRWLARPFNGVTEAYRTREWFMEL